MFLDDLVSLLVTRAGIPLARIRASSQATVPPVPPADGIVHLRQYGGLEPERTQNAVTRDGDRVVISARPAWQRPSCQVTASAPTFKAAEALAYSAYYALVGVRNLVVSGGVRYREIDAIQDPFDNGPDGNGHAKGVFHIRALKTPS